MGAMKELAIGVLDAMNTLNIEHIEAELNEYFSSVEYLPAEVKLSAGLMSQDLAKILADLIHAHGGVVDWPDGSYRPTPAGGIQPLGYSPKTYTP